MLHVHVICHLLPGNEVSRHVNAAAQPRSVCWDFSRSTSSCSSNNQKQATVKQFGGKVGDATQWTNLMITLQPSGQLLQKNANNWTNFCRFETHFIKLVSWRESQNFHSDVKPLRSFFQWKILADFFCVCRQQRVRRDINCLNEADRVARKRALERLKRETLSGRSVYPTVLKIAFETVFLKPLLRVVGDSVEKCRELSIDLLSGWVLRADRVVASQWRPTCFHGNGNWNSESEMRRLFQQSWICNTARKFIDFSFFFFFFF